MNLVIGLVLLACSVYIGFSFAGGYRTRMHFWSDLILFCNKLETEVSLFQNKLKEIISKTGYKKEWGSVMKCVGDSLNENNEINADKLMDALNAISFLEEVEKEKIAEFLLSLGKLDASEQVSKIKKYKQNFEQFLSAAKADNNKKGSVCYKLGIVAGCGLLILVL